MPDTIRGDFKDTPCSDCGERGGVYLKHWGPLVPAGATAFLDSLCFFIRQEDFNRGRPPKALGPWPKFLMEAAKRAQKQGKTIQQVLDEDKAKLHQAVSDIE